MRLPRLLLIGILAAGLVGCTSFVEVNPFLTLSDAFGISGLQSGDDDATGGSGSSAATEQFRQPITLTFANGHPNAVLDTAFVAWVNVSSLRTAEQQDALLANGYVQLTREVRLGSVFTLPIGTFVFNGPGTAGATPVRLGPAQGGGDDGGDDITAQAAQYSLLTPDTILVFSQPPVSCDSVAFTYSNLVTGEVLEGSSEAAGGFKTLAQVDVYRCNPFRPGLFYRETGGTPAENEYQEGQPITFTFTQGSIGDAFATVTIGEIEQTEEEN